MLFVKMFFRHITTVFAFIDGIINKNINAIFTHVQLKRLTEFIINTH